MKKALLTLSVWCLLLAGCRFKQLSREEALQIIRQEEQYPKTIDLDIYCSDPQIARKALDAGLESKGLLRIQRTQKLSEIGQPLIQFTSKAQPYLMATPHEDKALGIQKVKIADEDIIQVTDVQTESEGGNVVVEYTIMYKNLTPFSALTTMNTQSKATRKARFTLYKEGWRLDD